MSDRDELGELLHQKITDRLPALPTKRVIGEYVDAAISTAIKAGYRKPRKVTTVEELDALPVSAKLYSPRTGDVWWKRDGSHGGPWWEGSGGMYSRTFDFLDRQGETSVLWEPHP